MNIKTILAISLLGIAISQPVYAEKSDAFTQTLTQMSPEEKAPLVRMIVSILNDEMQEKYRNDNTIDSVSVNVTDLNTLGLNINLKPDARINKISQDADATKVLKTLFEKQMSSTLCWKNAKEKEVFDTLSISHMQFQIHAGDVLLGDKRVPLTWCQ